MKNFLLILFVAALAPAGFGQNYNETEQFNEIKGFWFNPKNKSYLVFKNDTLLLTLKTFKNWKTDTVGQYETKAYLLNVKQNQVKLTSNWYLTTGIRFWRLRDRCTYNLQLNEDENTLVLDLVKMNHKNSNTIAIFLGEKGIIFRRTTEAKFKSTNAVRYE